MTFEDSETNYIFTVGQVYIVLDLISLGLHSKTISKLEKIPLSLVKEIRSKSWFNNSSLITVKTSRHAVLFLFKLYSLDIPDVNDSWFNDLSFINIDISRHQVLLLAASYDIFVHQFV